MSHAKSSRLARAYRAQIHKVPPHKIGIMVDMSLDRLGLCELRKWAARKVNFVVIDSDTGEGITRVPLT
jgi:hypothetical protein